MSSSLEPVNDSFFLSYGSTALVFSILFCCFCCCGLPAPWVVMSVRLSKIRPQGLDCGVMTQMIFSYLCCGFVPMCLLCLGSLFVSIYGFMLLDITSQDYYGPMRVTDYIIIRTEPLETRRSGNTVYYDYSIEPSIIVDFGYDWACGTAGLSQKQCSDVSVWYGDCDQFVCTQSTKNSRGVPSTSCTEQEYQQAEKKAADCLASKIWNVSNIDLIPNVTADFDPTIPPGNSTDQFADIMLYGDCNACQAQFGIADIETAQSFRLTGGLLWIFGFLGSAVGLCCCIYFTTRPSNITVNQLSGKSDNTPPVVVQATAVEDTPVEETMTDVEATSTTVPVVTGTNPITFKK